MFRVLLKGNGAAPLAQERTVTETEDAYAPATCAASPRTEELTNLHTKARAIVGEASAPEADGSGLYSL